jgi:hypothetical protein
MTVTAKFTEPNVRAEEKRGELTYVWSGSNEYLAVQSPTNNIAVVVKLCDNPQPGKHTLDLNFAATWHNPGNSAETQVVAAGTTNVAMNVLNVDLDAMKVSHNIANGELPDSDETSPGAFVPLNNDDDDYDASNTADKDQSGSITGESDLLPIKLHKVDPAVTGSKYTLDIPTQVKIWQNSDRSVAVTATTEFDANADTTLYVEGITVGSGNIKINWKDGTTTLDDCDEIKVTVYNWIGPLNVPGYAIYQYKANGALGTSKWITPGSGTIKTGANSSDITILWNAGPVVGTAIYQVNADYLWDLEVNVVEVKIEAPTSGNAFTAGTPADDGTFTDSSGVFSKRVKSGSPGLGWSAKVTLNGPNSDRGVKMMRISFIQNLTFATFSGSYTTEDKSLKSSIEGNSYLDIAAGATAPYYSALPGGSFMNPTPSLKTKTIGTSDTPRSGPPLTFDQGGFAGMGDDIVDTVGLVWDFYLFVTAATIDTKNNADEQYTSRAKADWKFNGSGSVGQVSPYTWSAGGSAGVTAPTAWTAVSDGSQPSITSGTTANSALSSDTWSE